MIKPIETKSTFPWDLIASGTLLVVALVKEILDYLDRKKKTEGGTTP